MSDPGVRKGLAYFLLLVAIGLIAVALVRDGNNMWIALAAVVPALAAGAMFTKADPERARKNSKGGPVV